MDFDVFGMSAGLQKTCTYESFKNSFAYLDTKYKGLFAEQVGGSSTKDSMKHHQIGPCSFGSI
jgi:hypothetical protein